MITLGNIDFNTEIADADGVIWYARLDDGWDGISHRTDVIERQTAHGGLVLDNRYAARQLGLIGTAVAEDSAGYWAAYHGIATETNFLNRFTTGQMLLTQDEDITRRLTVVRTGLLRRCVDSERVLAFEISLRADDPLKYSDDDTTLTTSGSALNGGNAPTHPTFTLTSSGAPVLSDGDLTWTATASLPSGTVIDMGAKTVIDGSGNDLIASVDVASQWFALEPGTTAVSSTVAGTWTWRDAWL